MRRNYEILSGLTELSSRTSSESSTIVKFTITRFCGPYYDDTPTATTRSLCRVHALVSPCVPVFRCCLFLFLVSKTVRACSPSRRRRPHCLRAFLSETPPYESLLFTDEEISCSQTTQIRDICHISSVWTATFVPFRFLFPIHSADTPPEKIRRWKQDERNSADIQTRTGRADLYTKTCRSFNQIKSPEDKHANTRQ